MSKFIPMINCGYNAGSTPMCWKLSPKLFNSEEECDTWIAEHEYDFSLNESGGCVFPYELNEEGIKFIKEAYKI